MRLLRMCCVLLLCLPCAVAQTSTPGTPQNPPPPTHPAPLPPAATTAKTPPAPIPGFDINALERAVDPCVNFYRFACGTWMAKNPIPADQSRWGRFDELQERNREVLHEILEGLAAPNPK